MNGSVVEVPVSDALAKQVFNMGDYNREEYKCDIRDAEDPGEIARFINTRHVEKLRHLVRNGGWIENYSSFAVAEKSPPSCRVTTPPPVRDGKLQIPLYLIDGRHRREMMTGTEDDSGIPWSSYAENARVELWSRKDGRALTNKEMISISQVLNEAASAGLEPSFFDRVTSAVSCCRLFMLEKNISSARDVVTAELARDIVQNRMLGSIEWRQTARFASVAIRLATSAFVRSMFSNICEELHAHKIPFGITHLDAASLYNLPSNGEFCTALLALRSRLLAKSLRDFEKWRKPFCDAVATLCKEVRDVAARKGMRAVDLLIAEAPTTAASQRIQTVQMCIAGLMRTFHFHKADTQEAAARRMRQLRAMLRKVTGDDELGAERSSPPSRVRRRTLREKKLPSPSTTSLKPRSNPGAVQTRSARKNLRASYVELDVDDQLEAMLLSSSSESQDNVNASSRGHGPDRKQGVGVEKESRGGDEGHDSHDDDSSGDNDDDDCDDVLVAEKSPRHQVRSRSAQLSRTPKPPLHRSTAEPVLEEATEPSAPDPYKLKDRLSDVPRAALVKFLRSIHLDVESGGCNDQTASSSEETPSKAAEEQSSFAGDSGNEEDVGDYLEAMEPFQDDVPSDLPLGYQDPSPYTGSPVPRWARLATKPPSKWTSSGANPIEHASPFLERLYLPPEHRAHVVLQNVDLLRANHHFVFWRAAYNYFLLHPDEIDLDGSRFVSVSSAQERVWAAALHDDNAARCFFTGMREQLNAQGYCVLEGMLHDCSLPAIVGDVAVPQVDSAHPNWYCALFESMARSFREQRASGSGGHEHQKVWDFSVNQGRKKDDPLKRSRIGRYMTTNYGMTTAIEQSPDRVSCCPLQALLDARLGQVMAALSLCQAQADGSDYGMQLPRTGGRWVVTTKGCPRQQLHTDWALGLGIEEDGEAENVDEGCAGYLVMGSGAEEMALWICEGSHKTVRLIPCKRVGDLGKVSVVNLITIPPYSILVARGDVLHAGAGWNDKGSSAPTDGRSASYHATFVSSGYDLPDGLHLMKGFLPRFVVPVPANATSESDGEQDTGKDAVSGAGTAENIEQGAEGKKNGGKKTRRTTRQTAQLAGRKRSRAEGRVTPSLNNAEGRASSTRKGGQRLMPSSYRGRSTATKLPSKRLRRSG